MRGGTGSNNTLTPEDFEAMLYECPAVKGVSPSASTGAQVVFGDQNWSTRVEGYNEQAADAKATGKWSREASLTKVTSRLQRVLRYWVRLWSTSCLADAIQLDRLFASGISPFKC